MATSYFCRPIYEVPRYFLHMAYKGTAYHGWQRQSNSITVQEVLEDVLRKINQQHTGVTGCGRTDTGVHAADFYAHVDLQTKDTSNLAYQLNSVLPSDIAIYKVIPVAENAHSRFDATSRTYQYKIHHRKDPFFQEHSYYHQKPLDIEAMNTACNSLLGRKEFTSFARLHGAQRTDFCEVREAHWTSDGIHTLFTITADRFLRNMVRAIVGTLLDVGLGKLDRDGFDKVIQAKDRSAAGTSAPASGLYLSRVEYPYIDSDE
jgi:tRNA pseudouridine38-40 synthase